MFRIGIIGAGGIGGIRAELIHQSQDSQLAFVYDVEADRARNLTARFGGRVLGHWRELVRHPEIDIVVIATPTRYHVEPALAALQAGKHVFCEKPLARTLTEAQALVDMSRRMDMTLKTGFNYRHMHHVRRAREILDSGELGKIMFIRVRYGHGGRSNFEKEWYGDPRISGGGVFFEQGIHMVDLFRYFMGEPARVFARMQRYFWALPGAEDNAFCLLETAVGQTASLHISWTQWVNTLQFEIYGQNGYLNLQGRSGHYGKQRLLWGVRQPDHRRPHETIFEFDQPDDSFLLEWRDFIMAIREKRQPNGSGEDGMASIKWLELAYKSDRLGGWITDQD